MENVCAIKITLKQQNKFECASSLNVSMCGRQDQ